MMGVGRRQVAAITMDSNMVLSPISAMETRLVEMRKASKGNLYAREPRRTDLWRSQPSPAWTSLRKPPVLP